eukprot:jgi/Mesvir1/28960/Mv17737-RA.1
MHAEPTSRPNSYEMVDVSVVAKWSGSSTAGLPELLDLAAVKRFLLELVWAVVSGSVPVSKAAEVLAALDANPPLSADVKSLFADSVWLVSLEEFGEIKDGESFRQHLTNLAKEVTKSGLIPKVLLMERCELEFLEGAGFLNKESFTKKIVRVNTQMLYRQQKFNLLREESEGYSKLITTLCTFVDAPDTANIDMVLQDIRSLIGYFDLDPNRVFDIVLESFELHLSATRFLELIKIFKQSALPHIVGFKFQFFAGKTGEKGKEEGSGAAPTPAGLVPVTPKPTPVSLYRLAACLIKAGVLDVDELYPHLSPSDEDSQRVHEAEVARIMDAVKSIGVVNLASSTASSEKDPPAAPLSAMPAAADAASGAVAATLTDAAVPTPVPPFKAGSLEDVVRAVSAISTTVEAAHGENQKLGLLLGMLSLDDWENASQLITRLGSLDPLSHPPVSDAVCRLIEKTITPLYSYIHPLAFRRPPPPFPRPTSLPPVLFPMLKAVGPYLHRDIILLTKVACCLSEHFRLVVASAAAAPSPADAQQASSKARATMVDMLTCCLFPSLMLLGPNPALLRVIWHLLEQLPFQDRYAAYLECQKLGLADQPMPSGGPMPPVLVASRAFTTMETRKIMRRLSKENVKVYAKVLGRTVHCSPIVALGTIVSQIEAYNNMIAPVVDMFKYLTQVGYDVLAYVVVRRLGVQGRQKLKEDGTNVAGWLQSLAAFTGQLARKYASVELTGLLQYLANQLAANDSLDLLVLKELVTRLSGIEVIEDVSEDQLEAAAGGETLRGESSTFLNIRNTKPMQRSAQRLREALSPAPVPCIVAGRKGLGLVASVGAGGSNSTTAAGGGGEEEAVQSLALPLLILIAQNRLSIVYDADHPHVKLVGELYDKCQETFLQFTEFLQITAGGGPEGAAGGGGPDGINTGAVGASGALPTAGGMVASPGRNRSGVAHATGMLGDGSGNRGHASGAIGHGKVGGGGAVLAPSTASLDAYAALLPPVANMAREYRLDTGSLFFIYRPLLRAMRTAMAALLELKLKEGPSLASSAAAAAAATGTATAKAGNAGAATIDCAVGNGAMVTGDPAVEVKLEAKESSGDVPKEGIIGGGDGGDADMADAADAEKDGDAAVVAGGAVQDGATNVAAVTVVKKEDRGDKDKAPLSPAAQALAEVEAAVIQVGPHVMSEQQLYAMVASLRDIPHGMWKGVPQSFYVAFWSLSLYDICLPKASYVAALDKQRAALRALEESRDVSPAAISKRKKDKAACEGLITKLEAEMDTHARHIEAVDAFLRVQSVSWGTHNAQTVPLLIQCCFAPRALFSVPDAVFAAKFVLKIHRMGVPLLSTIQFLDRTIVAIATLACSCTENEASRLGRFFLELLQFISHLRSSKAVFEEEAAGKPGFSLSSNKARPKRLEFESYEQICAKWHKLMYGNFCRMLDTGGYPEIRNALIVLSKIVHLFPMTKKAGGVLAAKVAKVKADDAREDLRVLATRYHAQLQTRRPAWIDEDRYYMGSAAPTAANPAATGGAPAAKTARGTGAASGGADAGGRGGGSGGGQGSGTAAAGGGAGDRSLVSPPHVLASMVATATDKAALLKGEGAGAAPLPAEEPSAGAPGASSKRHGRDKEREGGGLGGDRASSKGEAPRDKKRSRKGDGPSEGATQGGDEGCTAEDAEGATPARKSEAGAAGSDAEPAAVGGGKRRRSDVEDGGSSKEKKADRRDRESSRKPGPDGMPSPSHRSPPPSSSQVDSRRGDHEPASVGAQLPPAVAAGAAPPEESPRLVEARSAAAASADVPPEGDPALSQHHAAKRRKLVRDRPVQGKAPPAPPVEHGSVEAARMAAESAAKMIASKAPTHGDDPHGNDGHAGGGVGAGGVREGDKGVGYDRGGEEGDGGGRYARERDVKRDRDDRGRDGDMRQVTREVTITRPYADKEPPLQSGGPGGGPGGHYSKPPLGGGYRDSQRMGPIRRGGGASGGGGGGGYPQGDAMMGHFRDGGGYGGGGGPMGGRGDPMPMRPGSGVGGGGGPPEVLPTAYDSHHRGRDMRGDSGRDRKRDKQQRRK